MPALFLLILCRLCYDFDEKIVGVLLKNVDEWFPIDEEIKQGCLVTQVADVRLAFKASSQELLNCFVGSQVRGFTVCFQSCLAFLENMELAVFGNF